MSTYGCDNDEDCRENDFFLQSKPGGGAGKRRKGRRVPVAAAPAWWHLVKIFDDPQNLLTKKPAARVLCECADDFDHEVVYSLTKKKRWAEVDAATLLNGAHKELAESRVVELTSIAPAYHHKSYERRVVALHELDQDGSVITRKAKGAGRLVDVDVASLAVNEQTHVGDVRDT
ncbi:hypothetical protein Q1695_015546 [Nippostrongylus brasiliensis]|nr:hypothetical protein Q1695_015546 [Nippostrongylus brasiliensis]